LKIAYTKYCLPIDLDGLGKPRGGTDSRRGLLENLAKLGHTIDIYAPTTGDPKSYKYGKVYPVNTLPSSSRYSVLMIEDGPTNVMFSGADRVPFLLKTHKRIDAFEGKIIYLHQDNLLYMVINLDAFSPEWMRISNGYGTKDLLKNREFYIFTFAQDTEHLLERSVKIKRSGYQYISGMFSVPPARLEWVKPFNPNPKNYLFYAGNKRGRKHKFAMYYGHGKCSVRVAGKWSEKYEDEFAKIKWLGQIPQGEVFNRLNKSVATVAIGDKAFEFTDSLVPRMFEAVQSGCILYLDSPFKTAGSIFGEEYMVSSEEELLNKIPSVANTRARKAMVEQQRYRGIEEFDMFNAFGRRFQEISKEIGLG